MVRIITAKTIRIATIIIWIESHFAGNDIPAMDIARGNSKKSVKKKNFYGWYPNPLQIIALEWAANTKLYEKAKNKALYSFGRGSCTWHRQSAMKMQIWKRWIMNVDQIHWPYRVGTSIGKKKKPMSRYKKVERHPYCRIFSHLHSRAISYMIKPHPATATTTVQSSCAGKKLNWVVKRFIKSVRYYNQKNGRNVARDTRRGKSVKCNGSWMQQLSNMGAQWQMRSSPSQDDS